MIEENDKIRKPEIEFPEENKPRKKQFLITGGVFFLALVICFLILIVPVFTKKAPNEVLIKIPANATKENVHDSVAKYLGNDYADLVMRVGKIKGSDFSKRHGAYLIEEGKSPFKAYTKLSRGAQQPMTITINGFRHLNSLAEKLSAKLDFSPDSLLQVLNNDSILKKYNLKPNEALALFIDDTYEVYWNVSPEGLIDKIGANYLKIWDDTRKKQASELGLKPSEVMILCSIVDEETNKADDKGKIGRLYINRLRKNMKLQADPTVKYAVGDFSLRRIRNEHLKVTSPYNTYHHTGLPPGPIKTTGRATIDSVLNSSPNDYLYMCAKEDFSGYHSFANTYDEHLKNARRYQQALNRRGIK